MERLPPKLLTGPSPIGAGQARALEHRGGDFQWAQRDANTVVKKQGDFRKVITSGGGYLTRGEVAPDELSVRELQSFAGMSGALPYQLPFMPGSWSPAVPIGQDQYMAANRTAGGIQALIDTNYTVHPPVDDDDGIEIFRSFLSRFNSFVWHGTPRGLSSYLGFVDYAHTRPLNLGGAGSNDGWHIPTYAPLVFVKRMAGPPADKVCLVPFLADLGRTDGQGRLLPDLVVSTWTHRGEAQSYPYAAASFTRANAEFSGVIGGLFAMPARSGFFVGEYFFAPGLSGSPSANPRVWLFAAEDHDYSAPGVIDVTDIIFGGMLLPQPRSYLGESWTWHGVDDGNAFGSRLALSLTLMKAIVLPDDVLLVAVPVATESLLAPDVVQWACRMARIDFSGLGSVDLVMNEVAPTAERDPGKVIDDMVHLGEGWVLAKQTDYGGGGNSPGGMPVSFLRSVDGGQTWAEILPTGFEGYFENQSFGRFTVHKSRAAGEHGVVLMTSWNPAAGAYHVYESRDSGSTWLRKGRVAKTASFQSLATYSGEALAGGFNFALLTFGGDIARPVDVTMPDRYNP